MILYIWVGGPRDRIVGKKLQRRSVRKSEMRNPSGEKKWKNFKAKRRQKGITCK